METGLSLLSFAFPIFAAPFALTFTLLILFWIEGRQRKRSFRSAFIERVLHVVSMRTYPKVFWIDASGIVASVTDALTLWNRTLELFIDDSVGKTRFVAFVFPRNLPVAFIVQRTRIIPTPCFQVWFNPQQDTLPGKEGFNYS